MAVPGQDTIDTASSTYGKAYAILEAKYGSAGAWATWAGNAVEQALADMANTDAGFNVDELVATVIATLEAFPEFVAPTIASYNAPAKPTWVDVPEAPCTDALLELPKYTPATAYDGSVVPAYSAPAAPTYPDVPDYTAPTAPTYAAVPSYTAPTKPTLTPVGTYTAPTLGKITAIPAIADIDMPDAPSAIANYTPANFTAYFHTYLLDFVETAMTAGSTGLGDAEQALFDRAVARENTARTAAYNEITYAMSSNGFPCPTGALASALITINNESAVRLTDINAQIMAESARLSNSYGQALLQASTQLDTNLITIWNSAEDRAFNKAREDVIQAVAVFTSVVNAAVSQGQLDVSRVQAVTAANEGVIKVYTAQIDAQIEPMKAIVGLNTALVQQYSIEVEAAIAPIKGVAEGNIAMAEGYKAAVAGASGAVTAVAQTIAAQVEGYKAELLNAINVIDAVSKSNVAKAEAYKAEIAAATTEISAVAQVNGAIAQVNSAVLGAYGQEVSATMEINRAASAVYAGEVTGAQMEVTASATRAEVESKAYQVASNIELAKADVTSKHVLSQVEAAVRQYAAKLGAFQSSAQVAGQMVASALNGVNVSSTFSWQGSSAYQESESNAVNVNIARKE